MFCGYKGKVMFVVRYQQYTSSVLRSELIPGLGTSPSVNALTPGILPFFPWQQPSELFTPGVYELFVGSVPHLCRPSWV